MSSSSRATRSRPSSSSVSAALCDINSPATTDSAKQRRRLQAFHAKNEFASLPTEFATVGKLSLDHKANRHKRLSLGKNRVCQFARFFEPGARWPNSSLKQPNGPSALTFRSK